MIFDTKHLLLIVLLMHAIELFSQEEEPDDLAPPPIKKLVEEEKKQIDSAENIKKKVELSLTLLEARLKLSEQATAEQNYRKALDYLGKYQALVEYMIQLFDQEKKQDRRFFSSIKNFEIALRRQTPRLELIRRDMPFRYAWHVQRLIRFVREARSKTLEPMLIDATG
ncbi:MAG: hypothetical protein N2Z23_06945 [Pyrinomonadaceae bacterium]|nr:hypothetical protein [Pyrinomonadaceae bacterium]MCX7640160.1 hypothetical protein [Pyrinomonadaceae bacterium]MDW8303252.1 hypothetical protein [Acidobacteriota bacterium]